MIKAIDVGFGGVKAVSDSNSIIFPSAIGNFRPVRFNMNSESQNGLLNRLCIEYEGMRYFIGDIAYKQSTPRATMNGERFMNNEGLSLMFSALLLLSTHQAEEVKIVTGLPVNDYVNLKDRYRQSLEGKHFIHRINTDGSNGEFYVFDVKEAKILPQPIGTIFDAVLSPNGEIANKALASGRIAVLDIGKHTVDLAVTDGLQFIDNKSTSFNDIGIFEAFKELSLELKGIGYDIAPESIEPYIVNGKSLKGLPEIRERVFKNHAEKILSRVVNSWSDLWSYDQIIITGGGALLISDSLYIAMDCDRVVFHRTPTFSNCKGYYKFAKKAYGL